MPELPNVISLSQQMNAVKPRKTPFFDHPVFTLK
jgi:hypothetical protein